MISFIKDPGADRDIRCLTIEGLDHNISRAHDELEHLSYKIAELRQAEEAWATRLDELVVEREYQERLAAEADGYPNGYTDRYYSHLYAS